MKKIFCALFALLLAGGSVIAQQTKDDPVIFEINGEKIYKSEFMKEFLQSIGQSPEAKPTACTYEKRKALEDYVQLFVNFRAKLADAYAKGMDTMPSLVSELATYRKELAAPYLIDSATMEKIFHEAYDRNHYVVHAAHILIRMGRTPSPEDTLKAYNQAMEVYNRVVAGEDFYKVADEMVVMQLTEEQKERPHKVNPQEGDLGCFTVFDMVYPFENAAFSLQPGEICKPIRTRYGYHVIKLFDKVEYFGNTTLQHIWVRGDLNENNAKAQIDMAYKHLQDGEDFALVAKNYSHDRSSAKAMISDASARQIPSEYVMQLAKLNVGEYSQPFKSIYGWHIVKLIKKESIPSYEDMLPLYKQKLSRDQRNNEPQSKFVEQAKKKYNFIDYTKSYGTWKNQNGNYTFVKSKKVTKSTPYASNLKNAAMALTDSVFVNKWVYNDSLITDESPLFELAGIRYTTRDFCKYIAMNQKMRFPCALSKYAAERYDDFITTSILAYADKQLETENPEFKELVEEYRRGLMIFSYNDAMIWNKSVADTLGFADFYNTSSKTHSYDNPEDSVYFWNQRARMSVITVADSLCLQPEKAMKIVSKAVDKGISCNDIRNLLVKKAGKKVDGENLITMRSDLLEQGHQTMLSSMEWKPGVYIHSDGKKGYEVIVVERIQDPTLKSAIEARGYYINDYQSALERELTERLRRQYHVKIYQDVIDEITY